MATYRELLEQKRALDKEIELARAGERAAAIGTIRTMMANYGVSVADLDDSRRGPRPGRPVKPLYRDPESGNTWTGRGKPPRWIAGRDRSQFLITD